MSLKTRINGFTAWINLRLIPYGSTVNDILNDLVSGICLKHLLHSLTGKTAKKIQSLDGLTAQQKITRVEWVVNALKESEILPDDCVIKAQWVAQKSADHIFDFLWKLVAHDIWFTWERMEFLQNDNDRILSEFPFRWTPEIETKSKTKAGSKAKESMFTISSDKSTRTEVEVSEQISDSERMKEFKPHRPKGGWYSYPSPEDCILEMINSQLQRVPEGRKLVLYSLDDLVDYRVLCGLINSFVAGTMPTELMLDDRWTINLALDTIGKMLYVTNPFRAQDILEADFKSVCSYLCFFFMSSYKLKQCKAVVRRLKEINLLKREYEVEVAKFPVTVKSVKELREKQAVETTLQQIETEKTNLIQNYDIKHIRDWLLHVSRVQDETRQIVIEKIRTKFELISIPRTMTINEICDDFAINLQLTQGSGFYRVYDRETCNPDRRIVLRAKKTKKFIDDFTGDGKKKSIREFLGLPKNEIAVIEAAKYTDYEIFVESKSRNKKLLAGTIFLYQVFPGNTLQWQRLFFKAIKDGDVEVVVKMITFFKEFYSDFIMCREVNSDNSGLHLAARHGHYDICKYLLENGAQVNALNGNGSMALFSAVDGSHKRLAQFSWREVKNNISEELGSFLSRRSYEAVIYQQDIELLIEWGTNVKLKNYKCITAIDACKNNELKQLLQKLSKYWSSAVDEIVEGNVETLRTVVKNHMIGLQDMVDIGARCIHGSTLLHTAAHFSQTEIMKDLIKSRVNVNIRDYQGATPIHRAKSVDALQFLLDSNADINVADEEGNSALHVHCYGQDGEPSFLDGISFLLKNGINSSHRNSRCLLSIHCAAMQGRQDVIEVLLGHAEESLREEILNEDKRNPPSLPYLAMMGDHLSCCQWLVKQAFPLKTGEADKLLYKILTEQLHVSNCTTAVRFLLENFASINLSYEGGDSILHLAVKISSSADLLNILLDYGAEVNVANDSKSTPLFYAIQMNNHHGAGILLNRGADVHWKNANGLTALDLVSDFDEWMTQERFTRDIRARFRAFKLKHARELVNSISKKVQVKSKTPGITFKEKQGRRLEVKF